MIVSVLVPVVVTVLVEQCMIVSVLVPVVVTVLNKSWCMEHFRCTACDGLLTSR